MTNSVLVVDDEEVICKILSDGLQEVGLEVVTAKDGKQAILLLEKHVFDVAIIDVNMPFKDGFQVLKYIKENCENIIFIMMTAYGSIEGAVKAIKYGADDYIQKPFDVSFLINKVQKFLKVKQGEISTIPKSIYHESCIIGKSTKIVEIKNKIDKIKNLDTTVLITGESGTGKNVVAREIHYKSNRKEFPFVVIDCASIPENLIESELFGYEKGAFTNALSLKKGKFEAADKGTVFLDEIGTLPYNLQSKLLNVIQEKHISRIGGTIRIPVDVRIIAATNENLENAVKDKRFREDLYYRLSVVRIECPSLRCRKDDILGLAKYFIEKHIEKNQLNIKNIDSEVWDILLNYDWPGNVRELENTLESGLVLAEGDTLYAKDISFRGLRTLNNNHINQSSIKHELTLQEKEIMSIISELEKNNGHRAKTAEALGISRRTLQYKLKKYNFI